MDEASTQAERIDLYPRLVNARERLYDLQRSMTLTGR